MNQNALHNEDDPYYNLYKMAHFKFEGDITGISAKQLEFISSVLEKRGYTNEKVVIQGVGVEGDNYMANVKRITIEKEGKPFKMIAKVAPTMETIRNAMNTVIMFLNEHVMYTKILPKFTELEKAAEVPENERLRYADCYGTFMEMPNEIIILEDLQQSNYTMLDRFVSLTDDTVRLVLKNFAMLHSLSYVLKRQEPETYIALKSRLINLWVTLNRHEQAKSYFKVMEGDILKILNENKYKKYIEGTFGNLTEYAAKCHKIDSESKFSVIQQGDSWTNNIMFRFMENKPVDCCMIDYQVSRESSPAADIHYLIFNCTDYETRSKHYNDWLDYYHTELDKALANYGLKANYIYPKDQFDAELRSYGKLSFCLSVLLASVLLRESTGAAKLKAALVDSAEEGVRKENIMDSAKMSALDEQTISKFKTRVEELVKSFVELGYLG